MSDFLFGHNTSIQQNLQDLAGQHALAQISIGPLKNPITIAFYEKWIAQDYHGQMSYLKEHLPFKKNPSKINAEIHSVISVAQSYFPAPEPHSVKSPARVATYAHNSDYHFWLREKLNRIIKTLQQNYPDEIFLPYVDSGPLLERDMAYQNGLGWFGKNTCLIHPKHGSLFFIAEILTSLKNTNSTEAIEPLPDFCGKCQKCLEACPTQAIKAPRVLKADECISYLTIESREIPKPELRSKIQDWFFGCDVCQTVCPWNEKVFRKNDLQNRTEISTDALLNLSPENRADLVTYFRFLLTASHKKIEKYHFGSPLLRAGPKGLKRNALIVIANQNLYELEHEVENLQNDFLAELAEWTLQQLRKTKLQA